MRYLGIDYGTKRTGVSISDLTNTIASPLETISYKTEEELISRIGFLICEYNITHIVLGNPINLDGSLSDKSKYILQLKSNLETKFNLPVILEDERPSTVMVERMLIDNNTRREKRKKVVDKLASSVILQSYLDRKENNNGKEK